MPFQMSTVTKYVIMLFSFVRTQQKRLVIRILLVSVNTIGYNTIRYDTINNTMQYNTTKGNPIQYNATHCTTIQYNTMDNKIQCTIYIFNFRVKSKNVPSKF